MLKRWRVAFNPSTENFQYRHLWVLLLGLPIHFWNEGALKAIRGALGCFISLDLYKVPSTGVHAMDWNSFTVELKEVGISLHESTIDSLIWIGGDLSGKLSIKNFYDAILSTQNLLIWQGWKINLWKWDFPLKVTLFFWLDLENILLTWDNLQLQGWNGPSIFLLCNHQTKDISHLFIHYVFASSVWAKCAQLLNLNFSWAGHSLSHCMD